MPTCRDIITQALRQARVLGVNAALRPAEAERGMEALQGLYDQWAAGGLFGRLNDVLAEADYEAWGGQRVRTAGGMVTLPETLEHDECAPPYDLSMVEVVDTDAGTVTRHLFDGGRWVEIQALELTDEAPLASKGRSGLAANLAISYAEMFGGQVGPGVARTAGAFKAAVASASPARSAPGYF